MERSLIQLSPSTAVVSLPSAWVRKNKLKKGAKLIVEENDNKVVIGTVGSRSERSISIDVTQYPDKLLWMTLDAAFTAGYDEILLQLRDAEQAALMTKIIRYFPGLIIEDERKNTIVLKDVAHGAEQDLDKLLSRSSNAIIAAFEDAIDAAQNAEWKTLTDMKRRDYTINTYFALSMRHLAKHGYTPFSKTGCMYTLIKLLEMFADKTMKLFIAIGEKQSVSKAELKMLSQILGVFRQARKIRGAYTNAELFAFESQRVAALGAVAKLESPVRTHATELLDLFLEIEEMEIALHL